MTAVVSMTDIELDESIDDGVPVTNDLSFGFSSTTVGYQQPTFADHGSESAEVFMSVVWQQNKLGASFYDAESAVLYVMSDCSESLDFLNSKMLLQQVAPSVVISLAKMDLRFNDFLRGLSDGVADDDKSSRSLMDYDMADGDERVSNPTFLDSRSRSSSNGQTAAGSIALPFKLDFLPNQDFGFTVAKQRLMLLSLPDMPANMSEQERHVYMSSIFPSESVNSFRSVGALLKYLSQKRVGVELEEENMQTPVLAVKHFALSNVMLLNRDAFYGLQIFSPLSHPSVYKVAFRDSGKEGLSLRLLFQSHCKSAIGRKTMSLWLLRPLQDLSVLNERLVSVSYFVNPKHADVVHDLQSCIKRIRDVSRILFRMVHAPISISEWKSFRDNLRACCELVEICRRQNGQLQVFRNVFNVKQASADDSTRLQQLVEAMDLLTRVIDFQQSSTEGKCVVKSNVDQELDEKRRLYASLHQLMDRVAQDESADLAEHTDNQITLVYEPQLGFFVTIPETDEMRLSGTHEMPSLEYRFVANGIVHYKSARTLELDERMGDVFSDMRDKEIDVIMRLQNAMLHITEPLVHVIECASSIDCLLAFASLATQQNYVRPIVTEDIGIAIINGRHPLQEQTCTQFIPNSTRMTDESKVELVTGPNSSGKSVYLKQVALIVYMAHLGSFVPAEDATIGVTDRIYSRIKTMDSVSQGLSAFVLDLNQVIPAALNATKRSLVVLDEFGKGTEAVDGAALLAATINRWLRNADNCPQIIVCTHLLDVVNLNLIVNSKLVKYLTTEVSRTAEERIIFLYKVVPGRADGSHAARVAQMGGLPDTVVARAKEVTESYTAFKPIPSRPINDEFLQKTDYIISKFATMNFDSDGNMLDFLKHVREVLLH